MARNHGRSAVLAVVMLVGCHAAPSNSPPPAPESMEPAQATAAAPVAVKIHGSHFLPKVVTSFGNQEDTSVDTAFTATLGKVSLADVHLVSDTELDATVPAGLADGSYDLTVTDASGRTGTLASAYEVQPPVAPPSPVRSFKFAAIGPQRTGQPFSISVQALDADGNVVRDFNGTANLRDTTGGALPAQLGPFVYGAWTGSIEVREPSASEVLTADDGQGHAGSSASFAVDAPDPERLEITSAPQTLSAGQCSGGIAVGLVDRFGAAVPARSAIALTFSGSPNDAELFSDATCSTPLASPAFAAGDASFTVYLRATWAVATELDVDAAGLLRASQLETITPGAVATLALTPVPSALVAGNSVAFSVTALDAYDNVVPAFADTLHFTSTDGAATLPADYAFQSADQGTHAFSVVLRTAGAQSVTLGDSAAGLTAQVGPLSVTPAAATTISLGGSLVPRQAGVAGSLTVTALDPYGNVDTNYARTVTFTSSDARATLPSPYAFGAADQGTATVGATLFTAGSQTVTATDDAAPALQNTTTLTIAPGSPASLQVAGFPTPTVAGQAGSFQVSALDSWSNVVGTYAGTVHVASSDPAAVLPADHAFNATDQGTHAFSATLLTSGAQQLTATDAASGLSGTQSAISVGPAAASALVVAGFPSPAVASQDGGFTVTARDPYGNVDTNYAGQVAFAATDTRAALPPPYTFASSDQGTHAFRGIFHTAGSWTLSATDSATSSISGSQAVNVVAGSASKLVFGAVPAQQASGVSFPLALSAQDTDGNLATTFTGQATLSITPSSTLSCSSGCSSGLTTTAFSGGQWSGALTIAPPGSLSSQLHATSGALSGASSLFDVVIGSFDTGPLASDPFSDGAPYATVFKYQGQLHLGTNAHGTEVVRGNSDGTSLTALTFTFNRDVTLVGGSASTNLALGSYTALGYTGCSTNTVACGPDNEDGRGLIGTANINGVDWLAAGGARSGGSLHYAYLTGDTGTTLTWQYLDFTGNSGTSAHGHEAMHVFHNRVYMGIADTGGGPHLITLNHAPTSGATGIDATTNGTAACDPTAVDSCNLLAQNLPGVGASGTPANAAAVQGVDFIDEFSDRLYLGNSGGLVRTTTFDPRDTTSHPQDWTSTTPSDANYTAKTSKSTSKTSDLFPADRAWVGPASVGGALYLGRNTTTGPQLWRCVPSRVSSPSPATAADCDPGDWDLVAANTTGDTKLSQFDDPSNNAITLVVANGSDLYVGYDNAAEGLVIYRSAAASPAVQADFTGEQGCAAGPTCPGLGGDGLGAGQALPRIIHSASLRFGSIDFLYVVAGDGTGAVKLFRTIN